MSPKARYGRYSVEVSNLDKVLFPDAGITKGDVLDYYQTVAPHLLPHIEGRPLTLQRFPDGITHEGFYQKEVSPHLPDWVPRVRVTLGDGSHQEQITADRPAVLAVLAQQATVTLHVWTSRSPTLAEPDRMVFDLDPPDDASFDVVRSAAELLRERLEEVGLSCHLLITGSRGAHVWVPLIRGPDFGAVRAFARAVADLLTAERPDALTTAVRKAERRGRLYVDVTRNARGQTVVAPYALRALPGAPVATPVDWYELPYLDNAQRYSLRSLPRRMARLDDPWKGLGRHAASLDRASEEWAHLHR